MTISGYIHTGSLYLGVSLQDKPTGSHGNKQPFSTCASRDVVITTPLNSEQKW